LYGKQKLIAFERHVDVEALGCDPGASFGIAWTLDGDASPIVTAERSGWWDLSVARNPGQRYDMLYGALSRFKPEFVFWETAPGLKGQALRWHLGYMAVAQQWAHVVGAEFVGINTFDVKYFAVGKRGAKKHEMVTAAKKKWLELDELAGDDAMDALWILETGLSSRHSLP
jgi:hypothetical protein